MALNVNTNLNIAQQSIIPASQSAGIVSDAELTNVAKEILTATPAKILGRTNTVKTVNTFDVKMFEAGYDVNSLKQIATNKSGFDLNISQNAVNNINTLKAQAAQMQATNLSKVVEGKIHINSEKVDISELKAAIASTQAELEIFESGNLGRDRKGPGGFYIPLEKEEEEEAKEGLNLVI